MWAPCFPLPEVPWAKDAQSVARACPWEKVLRHLLDRSHLGHWNCHWTKSGPTCPRTVKPIYWHQGVVKEYGVCCRYQTSSSDLLSINTDHWTSLSSPSFIFFEKKKLKMLGLIRHTSCTTLNWKVVGKHMLLEVTECLRLPIKTGWCKWNASRSVMSDSLWSPWTILSMEFSRPEYWSG